MMCAARWNARCDIVFQRAKKHAEPKGRKYNFRIWPASIDRSLKLSDQHFFDILGEGHANPFITQIAQGSHIGRAKGLIKECAR